MGTVLASVVVGDARRLLQDTSNAIQRWSDPVLLACLNEGQRALVTIKSSAYVVTKVVTPDAGTRQVAPADSAGVVRVVRNMGADGAVPGRAITATTTDELDMSDPNWHSTPTATTTYQYATRPEEPKTYFIYPPCTGQIEIVYPGVTPEILLTDPVSLDDIYVPALLRYICYAALLQDADAQNNQALSDKYFSQFTGLITGQYQHETASTSEVN